MKRWNLAVVGVGALGKHHARILAGFDTVQLTAVAEPNTTLGRQVAEQHRTRWVADYRDVLGEIDAAVIAAPTAVHRLIATDFLRRGIPVFIEKPIALNLAETESLIALARTHQTWLQVGHVERFNPAFAAALPLLREPRYLRAERYSPYAFRSMDIGVIHDVMIHDLDLALACVRSPVQKVEAFGVSILGGHEDCAQARLWFENGCIADLSANRVSPNTQRTWQAWSANGCVQLDLANRTVTAFERSDLLKSGPSLQARAREPGVDVNQLKAEVFGKYVTVSQPEVVAGDALTAELAAFVDSLQTGKAPLVGAEQALQVMSLAEQIHSAVQQHSWNGAASSGPVGPFLTPAAPTTLRLAG